MVMSITMHFKNSILWMQELLRIQELLKPFDWDEEKLLLSEVIRHGQYMKTETVLLSLG